MKKAVYLVMVLAIVTMSVSLVGCSSEKKKIVMGTNAAFEPFEYREGDNVEGFDVEIARLIAKKLDAELVIEDMSFEGLIPALQAEKIDFIAAGFSVNEERKKNADFSEGYYQATQVIIVKADNTDTTDFGSLEGKKLGAQISTTGADLAETAGGESVALYDNAFLAVTDMLNDKIDAVIIDNEPAKRFIKTNDKIKIVSDDSLTSETYAIGVRKGDTDLLNAINSVIAEIKENGEYDKLIDKFFN